jgi:uracil-DNA glycosylase
MGIPVATRLSIHAERRAADCRHGLPSDAVPPDTSQSAERRREALKEVYAQAQRCVRCQELAATRKSVVFGAGNADADLMFVGEAPGASEDEQGLPFVGRAGKLLETLLEEIGMTRKEVFIANTLKCRPPGNRDPLPVEIENCREYLYRQVELIQPRVICSLGNFATKLLRGDPTGITRLHGKAEELTLGVRTVWLYPIFHPAAALYTPRMLETLREDFAGLPGLLARAEPPQQPPETLERLREAAIAGAPTAEGGGSSEGGALAAADQLGLF